MHFAVYSKSKLARFGGLFASPYSWAVWNARCGVRQILGACERGRIDCALQLAFGVVGIADIDGKSANAEQCHERNRDEWQNLSAFSVCLSHAVSPEASWPGHRGGDPGARFRRK